VKTASARDVRAPGFEGACHQSLARKTTETYSLRTQALRRPGSIARAIVPALRLASAVLLGLPVTLLAHGMLYGADHILKRGLILAARSVQTEPIYE